MADTKTDFSALTRVLIVIGIILANLITAVAPVLVPALVTGYVWYEYFWRKKSRVSSYKVTAIISACVAVISAPALIFSIVEKVPAEQMTALHKIAAYAAAGGIIYFISVGISVGLSYVVLFIINSIKSN